MDSESVTHQVAIGTAYRLDGSLTTLTYNNVSTSVRKAIFFRRDSATTATLMFSDTTTVSFADSDFLYMSGRIAIAKTDPGVEMMGQYPKTPNEYDVGTPTKHWDTGYFNYVYGTPMGGSSLRSAKENISPFERNALEIINGIAVMRYNFKSDRNKTPLIGFIADDTDEDVAGKNHDMMMQVNCIGVLIKAVQELSAEIERLKERDR